MLAGSYGYTVTDANGCVFSDVIIVTEPALALDVTNIITDVNCFGESNGSIDLSPVGGTGAYAFEWANSAYQLSLTDEDLIGFTADTYYFQVTDDNGCFYRDTLQITEPPILATSLVGVDILCY